MLCYELGAYLKLKPELILKCHDELGESPLWDAVSGVLVWVDATGNRYHRLKPSTGKHETASMAAFTIALAFRETKGFIVCTDTTVFSVDSFGGTPTALTTGVFDGDDVRFNDGRVSPSGSLFLGSMHRKETEPEGALYQITGQGHQWKVQDATITSNGLGWSPDGRSFYYTDSIRKTIYAYDYDASQDTIANRRVFVDSKEDDGVPDGLCIDSEGCLWSARWNGWKVTKYDPAGKRILDIPMPVAKPTSCTFGGVSLSDLFITSARVGLSDRHLIEKPQSGSLFVVPTNSKGQIENRFSG